MIRFFYIALAGAFCTSNSMAQIKNESSTPIKVEMTKAADGKFQLLRAGQPYFVKGTGGSISLDHSAVVKVG